MQFYSCETNNCEPPAAGPCFIPCTQTGFCETATFRFKLPTGNPCQKPTEYVAFVVPQIDPIVGNTAQRCFRNTAVQCDNFSASERCPVYPRPCPAAQRCTRWSTEYRSTIDDCARRVLHSETICRRDPIVPQDCWTDFEYEREPAGPYAAPTARRDCELRPVTISRQKCVKSATPERCRVAVKRQITYQSISPRRRQTPKLSQTRKQTASIAPKSTQTSAKLMLDKMCETEERQISECAKPTGNRPMCRCKFPGGTSADESKSSIRKSEGVTENLTTSQPTQRAKLSKKDERG